jgi:hypothetical protein
VISNVKAPPEVQKAPQYRDYDYGRRDDVYVQYLTIKSSLQHRRLSISAMDRMTRVDYDIP